MDRDGAGDLDHRRRAHRQPHRQIAQDGARPRVETRISSALWSELIFDSAFERVLDTKGTLQGLYFSALCIFIACTDLYSLLSRRGGGALSYYGLVEHLAHELVAHTIEFVVKFAQARTIGFWLQIHPIRPISTPKARGRATQMLDSW